MQGRQKGLSKPWGLYLDLPWSAGFAGGAQFPTQPPVQQGTEQCLLEFLYFGQEEEFIARIALSVQRSPNLSLGTSEFCMTITQILV